VFELLPKDTLADETEIGFFFFYSFHFINIFNLFFSLLNFCISFYTVKDVLINPSNREELQIDKLIMTFNCPGDNEVGTTIEPNVPPGISKMFVLDFIFLIYFFLLWEFFFFIYLFFL
jgi:hypothetical protein